MVRGVLGCAVAGLLLWGCVDVEGGESGAYGSPCGTYADLLLCGREAGGADPAGGGAGGGGSTDGPATCADVCDVVVACFGDSPDDLAACLAECQAEPLPQPLLDCIVINGCNYPAACFGQGGN